MKRTLLIFATVVAIVSLSSLAVQAQVPNVQVFFDNGFSQTAANCPAMSFVDTIHVVALNFNMWIEAAEFMIAYPSQLAVMGEIYDTPLHIGNGATGISLVYTIPLDGFVPAKLMSTSVYWNCNNCLVTDIPVDVLAHPDSGLLRLLRWPDHVPFTGVGMRALICPTVPVEETSWGQIKNLYN